MAASQNLVRVDNEKLMAVRTLLPAKWSLPRPAIGLLIFGVLASLSAVHLTVYQERPWALIALLAVPAGAAFTMRRPMVTAALIIGASLLLMASYAGIGYADQTDLGRAAFTSLLIEWQPVPGP